MDVLGWLFWVAGLAFGLVWAHKFRDLVRTGQGVFPAIANQALLILAVVFSIPLFGVSPFHLIWLVPIAFLIGMFPSSFPFSLISVLGEPFGFLCCLGLDQGEALRIRQRAARHEQLVKEGHSSEAATRKLDALDEATREEELDTSSL